MSDKKATTEAPDENVWIIFRKSTNANSFGLRGYCEYNPGTLEVRSFATSHDLQIGSVNRDTAPHLFTRELLIAEGKVTMHRRARFEKTLPFKIERVVTPVQYKISPRV